MMLLGVSAGAALLAGRVHTPASRAFWFVTPNIPDGEKCGPANAAAAGSRVPLRPALLFRLCHAVCRLRVPFWPIPSSDLVLPTFTLRSVDL